MDFVRSIVADWERGDRTWAEWAHPEIEFVVADGPAPGRWTGLAGMAEGWRDALNAWEGLRFEVDAYRQVDDARVLVLIRQHGRGKASGLDIEQLAGNKGAGLFQMRDGKVTRFVAYFDRKRALTDLGLAE